jgi:hypothetical protein
MACSWFFIYQSIKFLLARYWRRIIGRSSSSTARRRNAGPDAGHRHGGDVEPDGGGRR